MPSVTVIPPSLHTETYFTFKEPINTYLRNRFNFTPNFYKLKVISIFSLKDSITNDHRDPFINLYSPAGISETDYKLDLNNDIPVYSFIFTDSKGIDRNIRVPLNYIESVAALDSIEYMNRLIIIDLNRLPKTLDITHSFTDLKDFITSRYGIEPHITETAVGNIELISTSEHNNRELTRQNFTSVFKTLSIRLQELTTAFNDLRTAYLRLSR